MILIEVSHVPAHFNPTANTTIPACWLAIVADGAPDDFKGVQSRWHDRDGAIEGAIAELPERLRNKVRIKDVA